MQEAELALQQEAQLVGQLLAYYFLSRIASPAGGWSHELDPSKTDDGVFVVTPHHTQRIEVEKAWVQWRERLPAGVRAGRVVVDTVEKMQGQEKDLVIVCYGGGLGDLDEAHELDFVYTRERINTALTRARKKAILICSPAVLNPSLAVTENAAREAGFELLRCLSARCRASTEADSTRLAHPPLDGAEEEETDDEEAEAMQEAEEEQAASLLSIASFGASLGSQLTPAVSTPEESAASLSSAAGLSQQMCGSMLLDGRYDGDEEDNESGEEEEEAYSGDEADDEETDEPGSSAGSSCGGKRGGRGGEEADDEGDGDSDDGDGDSDDGDSGDGNGRRGRQSKRQKSGSACERAGGHAADHGSVERMAAEETAAEEMGEREAPNGEAATEEEALGVEEEEEEVEVEAAVNLEEVMADGVDLNATAVAQHEAGAAPERQEDVGMAKEDEEEYDEELASTLDDETPAGTPALSCPAAEAMEDEVMEDGDDTLPPDAESSVGVVGDEVGEESQVPPWQEQETQPQPPLDDEPPPAPIAPLAIVPAAIAPAAIAPAAIASAAAPPLIPPSVPDAPLVPPVALVPPARSPPPPAARPVSAPPRPPPPAPELQPARAATALASPSGRHSAGPCLLRRSLELGTTSTARGRGGEAAGGGGSGADPAARTPVTNPRPSTTAAREGWATRPRLANAQAAGVPAARSVPSRAGGSSSGGATTAGGWGRGYTDAEHRALFARDPYERPPATHRGRWYTRPIGAAPTASNGVPARWNYLEGRWDLDRR